MRPAPDQGDPPPARPQVAAEETRFGERVDPEFARGRGRSSGSARQHRPAASSSAWTRRGRRRSRATRAGGSSRRPAGPGARRAKQKIDHGRRGVAGEWRTAADRVDFLGRVGASVDPLVERIYAVLDNPNVHSAPDVPQFALPHPRWEFVFPAQVRHLPGPDRALVEAAALPGPERVPLRRLGRDRASDRTGHRLLERAQARLRLASTAPVPPPAHSRRAETYSNLADAPLMLTCQTLGPVSGHVR